MIHIIGMGPGGLDYLTLGAVKKITESTILAGAERNLEIGRRLLEQLSPLNPIDKKKEILYKGNLEEFIHQVEKASIEGRVSAAESGTGEPIVAVLVSGDPGFFSLLDAFHRMEVEVLVTPGISSFQYLYSAVRKNYKNHRFVSAHGKELDISEALKGEAGLFVLTDRINSPGRLCRELTLSGFGNAECIIGENLSMVEERIHRGLVADFQDKEFSALSCFIVEKAEEGRTHV